MKGVMGFLEKAGLIKNGESDTEPPGELAERPDTPVPSAPADNATPPDGGVDTLAPTESHSLESIYAAAGVPSSVFPAERLLRLLDGLRAMDETTRNTAIQAMDAADDNWSIADPVADAQLKMEALDHYSRQVVSRVHSAEQAVATQVEGLRANQEQTVAEIRRQMAELEQLLERQIARTSHETASLESGLQATRAAANRELSRIEQESGRLRSVLAQFSPTASNS